MLATIKLTLGLAIVTITNIYPMQHAASDVVNHAVQAYLSTFPSIMKLDPNAPPEIKADYIVHFMKRFYPAEYAISAEQEAHELALLKAKICNLIQYQLPLGMHMPGFPFKSQNRNRCITPKQADLADLLCLYTLNHLVQQINSVYPLAGPLTIFSDGYIVKTEYDPTDEEIAACHQQWQNLMQQYHLKHLVLDNALAHFGGDCNTLRTSLAERGPSYAASIDEATLIGQSIYIKEDLINFYQGSGKSKNELKKMAQRIAPLVLCATRAYSAYIQAYADATYGPGNYIRFTPNRHHTELSKKFPITLMLGQPTLPWNGFMLVPHDGQPLKLTTNTQELHGSIVHWNGLACMITG